MSYLGCVLMKGTLAIKVWIANGYERQGFHVTSEACRRIGERMIAVADECERRIANKERYWEENYKKGKG